MRSTQPSAMRLKQVIMYGDTPFLPEEIIRNILKRLPIRSLIRFQCVSKHWKHLIKTTSFVEEHLRHSNHQSPTLIFQGRSPTDFSQSHFYLLDNEMQLHEVQSAPLIDLSWDGWIIGSSNGLLLLSARLNYAHRSMVLWNPASRRVRLVAKVVNSFLMGFGFSSIVNDYKIVCIRVSDLFVNQVKDYSLNTGQWKEVQFGNLDGVYIKSQPFSTNRAIFWFGINLNVEQRDENRHVLVSYDMAIEVFTLIPLPISAPKSLDSQHTRLTMHENKLAMLCHTTIGNFESSLIDLWVIEEGTDPSGGRWSWTKKYSVNHPPWLLPETIWRNEMVCHFVAMPGRSAAGFKVKDDERNVVMINLTANESKMFAIHKYVISPCILNYVESLVPVGNGDCNEEL
ncbi:putative F-box protein At3g16210 [Prosopis cineraria]|uniref:putative F-box protein At3g16210 n=1 Tax=Prosopis cineraria TaxID=364024 RepID=UPI00240F1415|nr:putative F-box protein At3g16210 [Prosopis cineraria]